MFVITCVDSSGGNAGLGDGNESKTRIYADKTTALNEAYRWYFNIYEYLKYGYCVNTEMLGRQSFIRQLTDPEGTYVVIQYDDFHIQFEYSEVGITSYLACEEKKLSDGILLGVTLLSVDEVIRVPKTIREFESWWWLRSPGNNTGDAAGVNGHGCVDEGGIPVHNHSACVRPALHLNLSSKLTDGAKLTVGDYSFTIVCDGKYALCDTAIGKSVFREDYAANDANVYETSDVKKVVDHWYEEKIVGREVRISCSPVMKSSGTIIYPEEITGTVGRILEAADLSGDLLGEVQELYNKAVKLLNGRDHVATEVAEVAGVFSEAVSIQTPAGELICTRSGAEGDYPGLQISLRKDRAEGIVAVVEYDGNIVTSAYAWEGDEPVQTIRW